MEGIPEEYEEYLRHTDPDELAALRAALESVRASARLAAVATLDLRASLCSMALDLHRENGACHHLEAVIEWAPDLGPTPFERASKAKQLVAGVLGIDVEEEDDIDGAIFKRTVMNGSGDGWFYDQFKAMQIAVLVAHGEALEGY